MDEMKEEKKESRRELLKKVGKTATFVVPTIFTYQATTMRVYASGPVDPYRSGHKVFE